MNETPAGGAQPEAQQPSADELRAYFEQLRPVPVENVLAETFSSLLMAAQAKIGRHDARLLIDTAGQAFAHVRTHLSQATAAQFEQALNQLRMAQVQAEQAAAASGQTEENDLAHKPAAPTDPAPTGSATPPEQPPASKLWIPGR